jgi:hypothetical protein
VAYEIDLHELGWLKHENLSLFCLVLQCSYRFLPVRLVASGLPGSTAKDTCSQTVREQRFGPKNHTGRNQQMHSLSDAPLLRFHGS